MLTAEQTCIGLYCTYVLLGLYLDYPSLPECYVEVAKCRAGEDLCLIAEYTFMTCVSAFSLMLN